MSVVGLLGFGLLLGFTLTMPPGPMNALIAGRSAVSWSHGVLTGLGAMSADALLGALVFTFQSTVNLSTFIRPVYAVGCGVMLAVGVLTLRSRPQRRDDAARARLATYTQGLGVGLGNPFQILWWLTAGIGFAYVGGPLLFVGLFGAIAIWIVAFPWVVRMSTRQFPRVEPWIRYASAVLMLGFGAYFGVLAAVPGLA